MDIMIVRRTEFRIILLGLLLRLLFIPFSMHVDPQFTGDVASFPWAVQEWNSPGRGGFTYPYPPLHIILFQPIY